MKYSKITRRLLFTFIVSLCTLLLLEINLRILGWLYSKKIPLETISGNQSFNILCLGDSFTYGIGIERGGSYPEQLEEKLNTLNPARHFKVFNLGMPGSNSSQTVKYLEYIISNYGKPDLVIVLTGSNDNWNLADSNIDKFINGRGALNSLNIKLKIFFSELRLYKMLNIFLVNLRSGLCGSRINPFKQIAKYEDIDEGILRNLVEYNLVQIIALTKSNNIKLILQNYPRGDVYGHTIQDVARRYSIPFLDNYSNFNKRLKTARLNEIFLCDIAHPNASGYVIMAEGIYKAIVEEVLK